MWKKAVFGTALTGFLSYVVWVSSIGPTRHQIEWDVATRVTSVLERTGFTEVIPGHGELTSIGEERRSNPFCADV